MAWTRRPLTKITQDGAPVEIPARFISGAVHAPRHEPASGLVLVSGLVPIRWHVRYLADGTRASTAPRGGLVRSWRRAVGRHTSPSNALPASTLAASMSGHFDAAESLTARPAPRARASKRKRAPLLAPVSVSTCAR